MSASYEAVIRDLLIQEKSSDHLVSLLTRKIENESPPHSELVAYLNFLVHAGYKKTSIEILNRLFNGQRAIPLTTFCYVLHHSGFKPGQEFIKHLLSAQQAQKLSDQMKYFHPWEQLPFFKNLREQTTKQIQEENIEHKKRHLEKLEYLRNNRMIDEEEKLINEVSQMYAEDQTFKNIKKEFSERWAREILSRKSSSRNSTEETNPTITMNLEFVQIVNTITSEMIKMVHQNASLSYDFAIGLYFLEQYESALNIIKYAHQSVSTDWFTLDLLLKTHRFVECLDAISTIEKRYAADPETTFGATYYRALALDFLGQRNTALQLLKSIVHIRPTYRSAHSLMLTWGGQE